MVIFAPSKKVIASSAGVQWPFVEHKRGDLNAGSNLFSGASSATKWRIVQKIQGSAECHAPCLVKKQLGEI